MPIKKLNLSGHENRHLKAEGFVDVPSPHVDLNDEDFYEKVTDWLVPHIRGASHVEAVLPGLKELHAACIVIIHGMTGQFPTTVRMRLDDETKEFVPYRKTDLHRIRNQAARIKRSNIVML